MLTTPTLLASLEIVEGSGVFARLTPDAKEGLLIFAAIALVAGGLLLWAALFRRKRRRQHARNARHEPATLVRYRHPRHEDDGLLAILKPRQRRRKRRNQRRNPTLAETGGLPPIRPPEPPEPPAAA
jgi:hypothetical protein